MEITVKKSENIKNLATKMLQVQKQGVGVSKSSINPFFKSKYADLGEHLEAILPLCTEAGIMVSQLPSANSLCTLVIDADSGEWMESYYPIIVTNKTPQEIASQITYSRRYSLGCIFNVNAVDDDGNNNSINQAKLWINKVNDQNYLTALDMVNKKEIKTEVELLNRFNFNSKEPLAIEAKSTLLNLLKPTVTTSSKPLFNK